MKEQHLHLPYQPEYRIEMKKETNILVVEDNLMDANMIKQALKQEKDWPTFVEVAEDGEKAVNYLQKLHMSSMSKPDLVILDLNLPKRGGAEILQLIRTSERLKETPVIIFSSSPEDVIKDIVSKSKFSADLYLTKPASVVDYLRLGKDFRTCYEEVSNKQQA